MVGGGVLGSIRKQVEQVMRSKLVSSSHPWPLRTSSCLQAPALPEFLPGFPLMINYGSISKRNPFLLVSSQSQ